MSEMVEKARKYELEEVSCYKSDTGMKTNVEHACSYLKNNRLR